jgi:selenium metabolism protein YedF
MDRKVDARGLACPQPVLMTKEALEGIEEGIITVLVDNVASKENVKRFAQRMGCTVDILDKEGVFELRIVKGFTCEIPRVQEEPEETQEGPVVLITLDKLGEEEELGLILMKGFISTLREASRCPSKILFMNTGVFLTIEDSPVLEPLKELEERGVEIYSCGTCLDYFGLKDKLAVGHITNMYDTVENLTGAELVVKV